jgi:hypothetical protein
VLLKEIVVPRSLRVALVVTAIAALAIGNVAPTAAGGPKVLDARMTGVPVANLVVDGVTGGGLPWVLDEGRARLFADGRLQVEVEGLVLVRDGTNPIPSGHAVVTCGGAPAASTADVPFSPAGDATVSSRVTLPSPCLAPAVFFTNTGGRWFAVTGF